MPDSTAVAAPSGPADIGPHRAHLRALRHKLGRFCKNCHRLFPLTWSGVFTLLAGVIGWCTLGSRHRDLVISSASFILGLLVLIMLLCVLINALRLYFYLKREDLSLEALKLENNYARTTEFRLNLRYFPLSEITWTWVYPVQVEVDTKSSFTYISETVTARHRCQAEHITRHFVVRDVLGLARIEWDRDFDTPVTIVPNLEKFNTNQVLPSVSDGDDTSDPYGAPHGDRIEMRKYTNGDSSRDIIWKVYARSRKLMVRLPERAITAQPRSCAYLVAGAGDEVSASLVRTILERRMLGDNWGFGTDGTPGLITSLAPAMQAIARSGNYALIKPEEAKITGLANFLQEAEAHGYNNCLVFVPARLAPEDPPLLSRLERYFVTPASPWPEWVRTARAALNNRHMTITWIIGVKEAPNQQDTSQDTELPPWREKFNKYALTPKTIKDDQSLEVTKALATEQTPLWLYESSKCRFLVFNSAAAAQTR